MRYAVLGAGLMGRAVLFDLARCAPDSDILVADYELERAREAAERFGHARTTAAFVDVRQTLELTRLLKDFDVVLNCTQYYWNLEVMRAAIEAGVHYLDLGGLFHITRRQMEFDADFQRIGKLALLGMGGTPGISNIAARFLADRLETVESIRVYDGSTELNPPADPLSYTFSIATILDELTQNPFHFVDGEFREVAPLSGEEKAAFPTPIGRVLTRHSLHSEVATLPLTFRDKGVREVFFKINYDPRLIEAIRLLTSLGLMNRDPIEAGGVRVSPRALVESLLKNRAVSDSDAQDIETIRVVVTGTRSGKQRSLRMDITARFSKTPNFSAVARTTGFPISIAAQMIAGDEIQSTGVRAPEQVIPATAFLKQLERRDMNVAGSGWPATRAATTKARAA